MNAKPKSWGEEIWEEKSKVQKEVGVIGGVVSSERNIRKEAKEIMGIADSQFLPLIKGKRILDAGVGPLARFSIEFCKRGYEVTGVDISNATLKFAQGHINKSDCKNIKLVQDDLIELKRIKEKFDLVFCYGTFGHVPSFLAVETLRSFNRVLKPEGFCLLDFWIKRDKRFLNITRGFLYDIMRLIKKRFMKTFDVNCSSYTVDELNQMIQMAGFEVSRVVGDLFLLKKL